MPGRIPPIMPGGIIPGCMPGGIMPGGIGRKPGGIPIPGRGGVGTPAGGAVSRRRKNVGEGMREAGWAGEFTAQASGLGLRRGDEDR